jgi:hypothetical protein
MCNPQRRHNLQAVWWGRGLCKNDEIRFSMLSALFWDLTQRRMVVSYRRCVTTCWSHLQGSHLHRGGN